MLKSIRLKNFKLHENTSIEAAPITVFIGPNNTGKSSIFQALLLLRQAAELKSETLCRGPADQPAPPPEPTGHSPRRRRRTAFVGVKQQPASQGYEYPPELTVDVGTFDEVTRRSGDDIQLEFSGELRGRKPLVSVEHASVSASVRVRQNHLILHSGAIECSGALGSWEFAEGAVKEGEIRLDDFFEYLLQPVPDFRLTVPGGSRRSALTASSDNETSRWLAGLPGGLLQSTHPIFAIRGFEQWGYPITERPARLDLMTLHDRALALPNALAYDRRLKERLSERLENLLGISIDFEVVPGKRLKIWAKSSQKNARETLFVNEGAGANQIPFIFVPVLLTLPNETLLLSEPEAHLHPKGQCELTRMLLTVAKKESIQFFIETHSEHVLHVILNAIGKGEWEPSQVAIYSFENVKGTAKATRLEVDEEGGVKGGLPGFFDQSLDELTEYLDTLKKSSA